MRWIGPLIAATVAVWLGNLAFHVEGWALFWTLFAFVGAVAETVALVIAARNGTLSHQVWRLRDSHPAWGVVTVAVMAWLSIHFTAQGGSRER